MQLKVVLPALLNLSAFFVTAQQKRSSTFLQVNISKTSTEELKPAWTWFGYDEPNYIYMKDGTKLLSELAVLSPVPVYARCHYLLTTGDGKPAFKWGSTNANTKDKEGNPIYNKQRGVNLAGGKQLL